MADHFQAHRSVPVTFAAGLNGHIPFDVIEHNLNFVYNAPSAEIIAPAGMHRVTLTMRVTAPAGPPADLSGTIGLKANGALVRSYPVFAAAVPPGKETTLSVSFLHRSTGERLRVVVGNTGAGDLVATRVEIAANAI